MIELRARRLLRGWSQFDLGRESGIHPTTISHVECGHTRPYPAQLKKLAQALGVRAEQESNLLGEFHGEFGSDRERVAP